MRNLVIIVLVVLGGCSKPPPLTDRQVELVAEQCEKKGKMLRIINDGETWTNEAYCE